MQANSICPICKVTIQIVIHAMREIPAANPSNPSMRFTIFVNPTIQNTVNGMAKYSKYNRWSPMLIKCTALPNSGNIRAAKICPINFVLGPICLISSQIPTATRMIEPTINPLTEDTSFTLYSKDTI